jgi:prepilin-type N-terminal cleavage/methylation domain-containing protein
LRRRGYTLVEVAVALGVVALVLGLLGMVRSSSTRQVIQLDSETELVRTALALRAHLARDLAGGLEPAALSENERSLGAEEHELVLASFAGYDGGEAPARNYRAVRYRFAAGQGVVRDGRPLGGEGLQDIRFHQAEHGAVTVELEGKRPGSRMALRFAGPARGTWLRAPHHRGARAAP